MGVESAGGASERDWQSRFTLIWRLRRGFAIRCALAATVLVPTTALTIRLGQPFAISAIASTAAIVLHAPEQYRQRPQRIVLCYLSGIAVSVPVSLAGAALGLQALLMSAVAAVVIVASPLGRVHPPTACIALAVTGPSAQPLALLGRWLSFSALALAGLVVLWLLTGHWPAMSRQRTRSRGTCRCDTS
jgi:hypothetical protein